YPAPAEVVNQCYLLRQPNRVMQGHLRHGKADLNSGGTRGNGRSEGHGVNIDAATIEVVFRQPDRIESELVTQLPFLQGLMNQRKVVRGRRAFRKEKIAEPHAAS